MKDMLSFYESFKNVFFSTFILLAFMLLLPFSSQAATETITYTYYNSRELKKAVYGTGKTVEYSYDSSGNRFSQTISSAMPRIYVSPASLSFAAPVGSVSAAQGITVTNTGSGPLDIERAGIKGSNAAEFASQNDTCSGASIPPSGSCSVGILFSPLTPVGLKTATLEIVSNAPNRPNFAITLSGDAQCSYIIAPELSTMPYSGGTGSVAITTEPGCAWTAASNNPWLSIISGAAGNGIGSTEYSAAVNTDNLQRTGSAVIAGQSFSVSQAGAPCTYTISPSAKTFGIEGGTGSIRITTIGSCAWTITGNPSWIAFTVGQNGSGSGTAQYAVQPNAETGSRQTILNVGGRLHTVRQGGTADVTGIGIFRTGVWMLDSNNNRLWENTPFDYSATFVSFVSGDRPVTGDWNGDGITEIGIFRTSGYWLLDTNSNRIWDTATTDKRVQFTLYSDEDIPVTGDWNEDGITEIGIFRSGHWLFDMNSNGIWDGPETDREIVFADYVAGDQPVTGDWNGNGKTKIGIYRAGIWMLDYNGNDLWEGGTTDRQYTFTAYAEGDMPITGDWNGSGRTKIGILRKGEWMLDSNGNGIWNGETTDRKHIFIATQAGDIPLTGKW